MNILITGANGLVGKNLIETLSPYHKVYGIIRNHNQWKFKLNDNITIIELDLTDLDPSVLPTDIEVVYYLAQSRKFREFPEGSEDVLLVNLYAPIKLVNWAVKNKVKRFIYASSGGVYTNPTQPVKEFFEINANEKLGFYLHSKLSAEMLLKCYASMFETFVILRPFFIYGPGQNRSMLIPRLIHSVMTGNKIILYGPEGIKINPIYVTDAVHAISKLLDIRGEYIINIAGKEAVSLKQLAFLIGKLTQKEPCFQYEEKKQNDLIADINLMTALLGEPKISLEEGLQKVIEEWD